MKVYGRRADDALLISVGGGVGVIMRGSHASKAVDLALLQRTMGPWATPTAAQADPRAVAKRLDRCRTVSLSNFMLGDIGSGLSFDERRTRVEQALCQRLGLPTNAGGYGPVSMSLYIPQNGLGETWVVYCLNGKHYGMVYDMNPLGMVTLEGTPVEVSPSWESMADRVEDARATDREPTAFDEAIQASQFYAHFKADHAAK